MSAALEELEREHPDVVLVDPRSTSMPAHGPIGGMVRARPSASS
jgi:hypothetical protein